MNMRILTALAALALLTSCGDSRDQSISPMQSIMGRANTGISRPQIYRVRASDSWVRRDPLPNENLLDTTKALCEYIIVEDREIIRIAIHNFPSRKLEDRVPAEAQVSRWRRQFESLNPEDSQSTPQAFSGYSGLLFEGVGIMHGKPTMVLGWAMQISPEHYLMLSRAKSSDEESLFAQMRGDVTIKAVGPKNIMEKYKRQIASFAKSFELIEEIPLRT